MQQPRKLALYTLTCIAANGMIMHKARADEKGDALLRQVRVTAQTLAPFVCEYTVTLHDKTGDKSEQYKAQLMQSGGGWSGGGILPPTVLNLFDPITRVPADTRYLGRKSVGGETYEVVELKLPTLTFQLYIGGDGLIHRAQTSVGATPPFRPMRIDPKTGSPDRTPEQLITEGVTAPTKTDARSVDVVVTRIEAMATLLPDGLPHKRFDSGCGPRAHRPRHLFAAHKDRHRGNRLYAKPLSQGGQGLRIHFGDHKAARIGRGHLDQFGRDRFARPAPGRPKVNHDRQRRSRNQCVELRHLRHVYGSGRRRHGIVAVAAGSRLAQPRIRRPIFLPALRTRANHALRIQCRTTHFSFLLFLPA